MNIAYAAPISSPHPTIQVGPIEAIFQASPIVQAVLLVLLLLSVISWAIILSKRRQFGSISRANEDFLEYFWKAGSLDEIYQKIEKYADSPVASVFKAGFMELQRIADSAMQKQQQQASANPGTLKFSGIDNLVRALRKAADIEIAAMENRLNFLATTGSTGPFIGLFGTVWGIMNAFHKIGQTGSASLAVVAPGISEALITTAIGLAAAIPAVVAYNHFISSVKKEELEVSNFTTDFLNLVKRDFFRDE